jgi:uncharacterized protein (TIGR02145 family)
MRYLLTSLLCVFTLSLTAQEACPNVFDFDNDGNVAVNDFLAMLGYFGDTDADSDGVWDSEDDCLDLEACNYSANPSEPCEYFIDALGICGGNCQADVNDDGFCDEFNSCGDFIGHQDYYYSTVQIGAQCWFAENCRYLPTVSPSSASSITDPFYYVFGYQGTDVASAMSTSNYETYGVLYNWPAVMTGGICPIGWHIPSDEEFTQLTDYLGGEDVAGGKMKEAGYDHWSPHPNEIATNSSGWTGLPGGYSSSTFNYSGDNGYWWSASDSGWCSAGGCSWRIALYYYYDDVDRGQSAHHSGMSARCVRD